MDFFRGIGDFFRGAFGGGDSEEEKRRKRQQQQAAVKKAVPQPVQRPSQAQQVSDLFGMKKNPTDAVPQPTKQLQLNKPPQAPPPVVAPPVVVTPQDQQEKARQQSEVKAFGKIRDPSKRVLLSKDEYNAALKENQRLNQPKENPVTTAILGASQGISDFVVKPVAEAAKTVVEQVPTAILTQANLMGKGSDALSRQAAEVERKFVTDDVKSGRIKPDEAKRRLADIDRKVAIAQQAKSDAEKTMSKAFDKDIKLDPTAAAKSIFDTWLNSLGTGGLLKLGKKTGEEGAAKVIQGAEEGSKSLTDLWQSMFGRKPKPNEEKLLQEEAQKATDNLRAGNIPEDKPKVPDVAPQVEKNVPDVRSRAQQQIDEANATLRRLDENRPQPVNATAEQHRQDIQRVIDNETETLNKYVNEHPDLTPQQIEAAQQVAKNRVVKLTDELKANRAAALNSVDEQAKVLDESAQARAQAVTDTEAKQAVVNTPQAGDRVQTPEGVAPELKANDPTRPSTEDVLYGDTPQYDIRGDLSIPQKLSPDRILRENVTRPIENKLNQAVDALQSSSNPVAQGLGRFFTGFSREAGVAPELMTKKMQLRGGVEYGKAQREAIADLSKSMTPESTQKVWATLDPEFAARRGVVADNLTPEEGALRDKLKTIIDNTTSENLRRGLITPEQAANGSYIKRSYSVYDGNTEAGKFERGFRQELMGQFKGRKQVTDDMVETAITDPTYLVGKKTAESNAIWAMQDYGNYLAKSGRVIDQPQRGFTQLPDSPVFGEARGKFVPQNIAEDFTGFQYNNALTSAFNDLVTAYDRLGIRQAKKQLLTIFNPAVRLGNQLTNRVIFSSLNGINPVQFNIAMQTAKNEIATGSQIYREAVQQGLTGVDISQADFFAQRIAASAGEDKSLARKALEYMQTSYSGADDQARVASYLIHRSRGYAPEEAARMTQRGFQDYKSVGFFYDLASKTPFIGNAFVRFASDSVRIAKNAAVDHPLRSMATLGTWAAFVNGMSVLSGESQLKGDNPLEQGVNLVTGASKSDAQKGRESRFGAPKIPFTDVSTTVQTPWGEVNVARFMPWYQLNEIGGNVSKFLPFQQSPVGIEDGKVTFNGAGFQDPLLGQVAQLAADKDFRNKSIQDPQASGDKFALDPLSNEDKWKNVLRWFATNNAPLGKEADQTISAATGQPDIYGKERNIWQALLRDMGVKVEEQGAKQQQDRQSMEAYQQEKAQIDKELQGLDPASQEAYKRLTGYYKLRETVPNEFDPTKVRNKKAPVYDFGEDKWKEYAAHPELYKLMVAKKQREAAADGKPIQPEFDERLPEAFRKQLIQNKMVAPGDDAELDQRMYSSPEWDYYQKLKDDYKAAADKYYPDNGSEQFDDETVKHQDAKFPEKPALLKAYGAAYGEYLNGKRNKPQFTDEMKALKTEYNKQTFNWTNNERAARGLPAITWDMWNNPTFGYDETPSGAGFGFGGFGGGGGSQTVNTLGELTHLSSDINRLNPIEAQAMPDLMRLFAALQAGKGGGKPKPKLGASSSGT